MPASSSFFDTADAEIFQGWLRVMPPPRSLYQPTGILLRLHGSAGEAIYLLATEENKRLKAIERLGWTAKRRLEAGVLLEQESVLRNARPRRR